MKTTRRDFLAQAATAVGALATLGLAPAAEAKPEPPEQSEPPQVIAEVLTGYSWGARVLPRPGSIRITDSYDFGGVYEISPSPQTTYVPTEVWTPTPWPKLKPGNIVRFRDPTTGEIETSWPSQRTTYTLTGPPEQVPNGKGGLVWRVAVEPYEPAF